MRKNARLSPPEVNIKSDNLQTVPTTVLDGFFEAKLTSEEKYFLLFNADIYFHIYGLWHNYSNKPIRLEVKDIVGLSKSEEIYNNPLFQEHQKGKYNSLCRRVHDPLAKNIYIVD